MTAKALGVAGCAAVLIAIWMVNARSPFMPHPTAQDWVWRTGVFAFLVGGVALALEAGRQFRTRKRQR